MIGARDMYSSTSTGSAAKVDGFNLTTNTWDPAGTWPDIGGGSSQVNGGAFSDIDGNAWTTNGQRKLNVATKTWSTPLTQTSVGVRYPWVRCDARNMVFGLCHGGGWGGGSGIGDINAVRQVGNVQTQITFNPSAALTQFAADQPAEAGMAYDEVNDNFMFMAGNPAGRSYIITPNDTTVWDMAIHVPAAGSAAFTPATAGIQARIQYMYSGFVVLSNNGEKMKFIRTS
jgi:hypothetical protein